MDLLPAYNQLNFFIGKFLGSWYPPEELDAIVDFAQLAHYKSNYIKYGTGQRLTDAQAPFKKSYSFDPLVNTNPGGLINTPSDYMDLITLYTITQPGNIRRPVPILNEDEITNRINSQVIPLSVNAPFAEIVKNWNYQLYPQVPQTGVMTYFIRPPKPFFKYTLVSGRVIVYDSGNSTQLVWSDEEIQGILVLALQSIGINLSEQDLLQWGELKNQQNLMSVMKV